MSKLLGYVVMYKPPRARNWRLDVDALLTTKRERAEAAARHLNRNSFFGETYTIAEVREVERDGEGGDE